MLSMDTEEKMIGTYIKRLSLVCSMMTYNPTMAYIVSNSQSSMASTAAFFRKEYMNIPRQSILLPSVFLDQGVDPRHLCGQKMVCHDQAKEIMEHSQKWLESNHVWDQKSGRGYLSLSPFVYPVGDVNKITAISNFLSLGWFIDDKYDNNGDGANLKGRSTTIEGLQMICKGQGCVDQGRNNDQVSDSERALKKSFEDLTELGCHAHLLQEIKDEYLEWLKCIDATPKGDSIEDYILFRRCDGGLKYVLKLGEFCCSKTSAGGLDRTYLKQIGVHDRVKELEMAFTDFVGLTNDVMSFEKEVIKNMDTWNFVVSIYHNADGTLTVEDALREAGQYCTSLLKNYLEGSQQLKSLVADDPNCASLVEYIDWLDMAMKACWIWQFSATDRYISETSIYHSCE